MSALAFHEKAGRCQRLLWLGNRAVVYLNSALRMDEFPVLLLRQFQPNPAAPDLNAVIE
jgi:hypothetical protein